jgi:hypothetical protein
LIDSQSVRKILSLVQNNNERPMAIFNLLDQSERAMYSKIGKFFPVHSTPLGLLNDDD